MGAVGVCSSSTGTSVVHAKPRKNITALRAFSYACLLMSNVALLSWWLSPVNQTFLATLPNASTYEYTAMRPSGAVPRGFEVKLSPEDRVLIRQLLKITVEVLNAANATYMLYAGSLIGSFRHHDIVPWDDDIDLFVDQSKKAEFKTALKSHPRGSEVMLYSTGVRWKISSTKGHVIKSLRKINLSQVPWTYPFIDISFYRSFNTYIDDSDVSYNKFKFPNNWIFPLCRRPFMGYYLPAPRQTKKVLSKTYRLDRCVPLGYSHRLERKLVARDSMKPIPCSQLHRTYAFVADNTIEISGFRCEE